MYAIQTTNKKGATMKKMLIILMVIVAVAVVAIRVNELVNPPAVACEATSTVAHQGDTHWDLEQEANCTGGYDKRDRVDAIIELNGGSETIMPGQLIIFPQGK